MKRRFREAKLERRRKNRMIEAVYNDLNNDDAWNVLISEMQEKNEQQKIIEEFRRLGENGENESLD